MSFAPPDMYTHLSKLDRKTKRDNISIITHALAYADDLFSNFLNDMKSQRITITTLDGTPIPAWNLIKEWIGRDVTAGPTLVTYKTNQSSFDYPLTIKLVYEALTSSRFQEWSSTKSYDLIRWRDISLDLNLSLDILAFHCVSDLTVEYIILHQISKVLVVLKTYELTPTQALPHDIVYPGNRDVPWSLTPDYEDEFITRYDAGPTYHIVLTQAMTLLNRDQVKAPDECVYRLSDTQIYYMLTSTLPTDGSHILVPLGDFLNLEYNTVKITDMVTLSGMALALNRLIALR